MLRFRFKCAGMVLPLLLTAVSHAQVQVVNSLITTLAGGGSGCAGQTDSIGDGCPSADSALRVPTGDAVDSLGNLYIADANDGVIRKVSAATGEITSVAGTVASSGFSGDNGPATSATFSTPFAVAVDAAGDLFIVDQGNVRIREVSAATGDINTIAGDGSSGYTGDNGQATSATLKNPSGIAVNPAGTVIYISDSGNNVVRMVNLTSGIITTYAGNGTQGNASLGPVGNGGQATSAELSSPAGLALDANGNLYIADTYDSEIRKVTATTGIITAVAGTGSPNYGGDNGPATSAFLYFPSGVTVDSSGNLLIADTYNCLIREVNAATGIITTVAGNPQDAGLGEGGYGGDNGPPTLANLNLPDDVAVDSKGNLYIADTDDYRVRKVGAPNSQLNFPATAVGGGATTQNVQLYFSPYYTEQPGLPSTEVPITVSSISIPPSTGGVQEFTVGTLSGCVADGMTPINGPAICTVPVTFKPGYPGLQEAPLEVVTNAGTFYFGLSGIGTGPQPALLPGVITTVAGTGATGYTGDNGPATSATFNGVFDVAVDYAGNQYIDDYNNEVFRKVTAATGIVTTFAGNGMLGYSGDNGPATSAELYIDWASGTDAAGNVYIADTNNNAVREVSAATGIITTIVGDCCTFNGPGFQGYNGDGIPAVGAELFFPESVAADTSGNIYIADYDNNRIREVNLATGIITTVAGNGFGAGGPSQNQGGYSGDNGPATSAELNTPAAVALDSAGNLYIADSANLRVRKVTAATGIITTVAGDGTFGNTGDNGPATDAEMNSPVGVAVDAAGDIYIAFVDEPIRKVDAATGIITTVAGGGSGCAGQTDSVGDGCGATSANVTTQNLSVDSAGNLYIADDVNDRARKVSLNTAPITFPQTAVNSTSAAITFKLANLGNAPLTLSSIAPSANFNTDSGTTTCSTSDAVPSGGSCVIGVVFSPTTGGALTGTLTLTDNALNVAGSTQQVALNGTIPAAGGTTTPTVTVSPSPTSITTTQADTVTVTVSGSPTPTGSVTLSSGSYASAATTLVSGSTMIIVPAGSLATGSDTLTATYTPDSNSSSIYNSATGTNSVTVTAAAEKYGPPTSGTSAAILFVPAVLNPIAGATETPANKLNGAGSTGNGGLATAAQLSYPVGMAYDSSGNLFFADANNYVVRRIDHTTGDISVFAGTNATSGDSTGGGVATSAELGLVAGLVVDSNNNVYVSDRTNGVVWKITSGGTISIFAGGGTLCGAKTDTVGDGCPATQATINNPWALGVDSSNNIYIADSYNELIREVSASTNIITAYAGVPSDAGTDGTCNANLYTTSTGPYLPSQAHLCFPDGIGFDSLGNVYIAEAQHDFVREIVASTGDISIFAGTGTRSSTGDGGPAIDATLNEPAGVFADAANRIYISDFFGGEIRMVDSTGNITDVMGGTQGELNAASLGEPDTESLFINNEYTGAADGIFGIAMDIYGNIVATDSSGDAITSAGATGGGAYYFGNQQIYTTVTTTSLNAGSSFYPPYVLISNPSGVNLTFTGTPTVTGPFAITGGTCAFPGTLTPGQSCTVIISFTPTADQSFTGTITLDSNSNSSPNTINLSGAGIGTVLASATLLPNPVSAFSSPAGVTSASKQVTLTNTSTPSGAPITITGATIAGTNPTDFAIASTTCPASPATLAGGGTCVYNVTFTPAAATTYGAQLQVTVANYGTVNTNLSGTGTAAVSGTTLSPTPLAFGGEVYKITSPPQAVVLSNGGSTTLTGITPTLTGTNPTDFAITTGVNACGTTLAANSSCNIWITFRPINTGNLQATLSVADSASNTPQTATLTGTYVYFYSNVGTTVAAQPVSVYIATAGTASTINVLTQGAANLDFTEASGGTCATGTAYTIGEICTVNVIFNPKAPGARLGAVFLANASGNVLGTTYLPGTGQAPEIVYGTGVQSTLPSYSGGNYSAPLGVTVDASLNVYVADTLNSWIIKTPWTGTAYGAPVKMPAGILNQPSAVAVDGSGNLFIADTKDFQIVEVPWNGSSYGTPIVLDSSGLPDADGIAVDANGNLFFTDGLDQKLVEMAWTGSGYGSPTTITAATGLHAPHGLAVDSNLNVYIADSDDDQIVELPWTGTAFGTETVLATGLFYPEFVAVDAAGDVYIANTDAASVLELPANGSQFTVGFSGIGNANGLAVDSNGSIYVADGTKNDVVKLNVSSPPSLTFASTNVGADTDPAQTVTVWNIGNGSLYFNAAANNPVYPVDFPINSSDSSLCEEDDSLNEGASCDVSVNFKPTVSGLLSEDVVLTDNNLSSTTQSIPVSGTGTGGSLTAQAINFTQPTTPVTYSSGLTIPLVATGGASGNPVVFTIDGSSTGTGSISGSTLTVSGVGSFVIDANQAGNSTYSAAPQVQRTVVVTQASQTISFTPTSPVTYSSGLTIPLVATGGASGNPVVFTIDSSSTATGSISGSTLTVTSTGNLVIDANQTGNTNYSAAPQVQRMIVVNTLLAQAITFTQPTTPVTYSSGLTIPLVATGGASGNPVVFTIDVESTGGGSISGSTLTVVGVGTFIIDANQAGNSTYSAAPQVQRTVVVNLAPQTINFTQPTSPVTYSSGLTIPLVATGGASGNPVVFSIDESSTATGSISGSTLTVTSTGNLVIDANQAGGTNYTPAPQVQRTIMINAPAPDFSVTATPPSQTIEPGGSATYPVTVTDVGASFSSAVTLSVSGLPPGATGTFNPPTVTPGSEGGSSTLTVATAATAGLVRTNLWPIGTPVLALIFMLPFRRWRKAWQGKLLLLAAALVSLAGAASLMGCGGGFGLKTSQTYTLTITGTSGADAHSTTVQLTVEQ